MRVPAELRAFHGAVMRQVMSGLSAEIQEKELTPAQISTLFRLRQAGRLTVSDIGAQLGLASGTTSHLVDRLVNRGMVLRVDSVIDRRRKDVSLSPDGTAFLRTFDAWLDRSLADLLRPVPAVAVEELAAVLSSVLPHLTHPEQGGR